MKLRLKKSIDRLTKRTRQGGVSYNIENLTWLRWLERTDKKMLKNTNYFKKQVFLSPKVRRYLYSEYEWEKIKQGGE